MQSLRLLISKYRSFLTSKKQLYDYGKKVLVNVTKIYAELVYWCYN